MASVQSSLETLESTTRELAAALRLPAPRGQSERAALIGAARRAMQAPNLEGITVDSDKWLTRETELETLINAGLKLVRIHVEFDPAVMPDAWNQDLFGIKQILVSRGDRWWRWLSGDYRRAQKRLLSLLRPPRPSGLDRLIQLIDAATESQEHRASIKQYGSLGEELFGPHWKAEASDWEALLRLTDWMQGLNQEVASGKVPAGLINLLAANPTLEHLGPLTHAVENASQAHLVTAGVIRDGLEAARRDLLDLGMRNPLLNYRLLRTRGLEVVDELPDQVYRILADEGKTMSFLPASDEEPGDPPGQPEEEAAGDEPAARHTDTRLQTALSSHELQTRLLSTHHLSNSFIQEQGVNTLYLALGMLTWYESESSRVGRRAPLVLIPVALERSNVKDRFHLRHTGEDPGANLSLIEKVREEFGLTLPGLADGDDLDINAYFYSVETAMEGLPKWSLDRQSIVLSFFSFSKFLMYRDLDVDLWPDSAKPTEHPIIGALLHQGFDEPAPSIDDDDHLDQHLTPNAVRHVLDADGSQTLALVDVNDGRNLVVQGPPGTGKSQTITNMIAEAIGRGRTVLFVSEKMAALEVVKRRLDNVGLGDACLELHSRKTTKKAVLEELQRTLELGRPRLGQIDADLDTLSHLRERLNSYSEAVNTPIEETGVSPYQAYGELALLKQLTAGLDLPRLDTAEMASWSESDFRRREELIQELQTRLSTIGVPQSHPFWGSRLRVFLPAEQETLGEAVADAQGSLARLDESANNLAGALGLIRTGEAREPYGLCLAARKVIEAPDLTDLRLESDEWCSHREELRATLDAGLELAEIKESFGPVLSPAAWDQELLATRRTLDTKGRNWWRLLSGEYRKSRRDLASLCTGPLPTGTESQLQLVDAVLRYQTLRTIVRSGETVGRSLFGDRYQGESSDWPALTSLAGWVWELYQDVDDGKVPEGIVDLLAHGPPNIELEPYVTAVEEAQQKHIRLASTVVKIMDLDVEKRFSSQESFHDLPVDVQKEAMDEWRDRFNEIHDIVSFNNISDTCRTEGLAPVIAAAETWTHAASHLLDAFRKAWFEALLVSAFADREALAGFDGNSHQQAVERFREMDSLALRHNQARLAHSHWEGLPRQEGGGQLGVLRKEFQKRRRHLAIRQLMDKAGNAVQAIKPVFMMSPLSIATYIPPGSLKFDLVIFDEASQVRPVESLGAIMRAGQAVVVGDDKQLPPTSFFEAATQGSEEDEESATLDIQSVLGLFASKNAPNRMLSWHYRSQHESLIAVSNKEFYDNRLVVFPSPDAGRKELGLRLRRLPDTVYERGKSRINPQEAEAVAQAVIEHAVEHPNLSLGVAAFSVAQMRAVLDQVELLRREDSSHEDFFSAHLDEPFFVKNLETVQGDERDVIFISVGYGRDADGRVDMNFGPLNWDGGERRLNVLITRARLRCEVFTNLGPEDIRTVDTSSQGLRALKEFLSYAAGADEANDTETPGEPVPPLQKVVADTLAGLGYEIRHRLGAEGHSIDLAVVDPDRPGRYVLGIQFDGPSYRSSRSTRDRDRLHHQVLGGLGWNTHRIWSTDWFRNPEREVQRMLQSIQNVKSRPTAGDRDSVPASNTERHDSDAAGNENYNIPEYTLANPKISIQGPDLTNFPATTLALWVAEVVEVESPVHTTEVARRIADAAGIRRIKRFQEVVDRAIEDVQESGRVTKAGDFLWWRDMEGPLLRDRSKLPASSRKVELLAQEELALAVHRSVAASYGIAPDDVPGAAARLLGFGRVTNGVRAAFEPVIKRMVTEGKLVSQGEQLVIADQLFE